jgi:hypothetical protein
MVQVARILQLCLAGCLSKLLPLLHVTQLEQNIPLAILAVLDMQRT